MNADVGIEWRVLVRTGMMIEGRSTALNPLRWSRMNRAAVEGVLIGPRPEEASNDG